MVNLKLKDVPGLTGLLVPESKVLPSSLVTVCGACVVFIQMTVVPAEMVSVVGLNANLPLLSVVMVTVLLGPEVAVVAVGVGLLVGVLPAEVVEVAVGVAVDPVVVLLPQAASSTRAPSVSRKNQSRARRAEANVSCCIVFSSCSRELVESLSKVNSFLKEEYTARLQSRLSQSPEHTSSAGRAHHKPYLPLRLP